MEFRALGFAGLGVYFKGLGVQGAGPWVFWVSRSGLKQ